MKKIILAYGTLTCSVAALIMSLPIGVHHPLDRDASRGRPRSIQERMLVSRPRM